MKSVFRAAIAAAILSAPALSAGAATFNFTMGTANGSFGAPAGGGVISAFSVTLSNTVFDTLAVGAAAPVYSPMLNPFSGLFDIEFTGAGQSTGFVFNSVATAECPANQCALSLFDTAGGIAAPEFLAVNTVTLQNIAFGFYAIDPTPLTAPVPLPASVALLPLGLGALGLLARRRRREAATAA